MPIEGKTKEYKSHKHTYNVYVDLNTKTKLGKDLLEQYHDQTKRHCMDIGRIGYHDQYGRYIIDEYTKKELIVVPKLIIRVREQAIDRAGKDVYQLRTYMSKFGQLNFLLLVDKDKADLILVENIYVENINHKEDYETLLWRLTYHNQKVPLKEIFYKFGIQANPDDYGKRWKEADIKINNILVSTAKAAMTIQLANKVASAVNQKALVASLNFLNKENSFGKKVTNAYSKTVSTKKEINKLATSPKLENTLNNILIKTLEDQTTKKDLKDKTNFKVYKKVLDVQMSCPMQVAKEVSQSNNKQNLKHFLLDVYQKPKKVADSMQDQGVLNALKHAEFEKIIDHKYENKVNKESNIFTEEIFNIKEQEIAGHINYNQNNFKDFDNKKVLVNLDTERFMLQEDKNKKRQREKQEKFDKKQEKIQEKIKIKAKRKLKMMNAECDLDIEFQRSKTALGLEPEEGNKKKRRQIMFLGDTENKSKQKRTNHNKAFSKKESVENNDYENVENESIIRRIEKRVKSQINKKEAYNKKDKVVSKTNNKDLKELEKDKKRLFKEYGMKEKQDEKRKKVNMILFASDEKKQEKLDTKQSEKKDSSFENTKVVHSQKKEESAKTNKTKEETLKQNLEKSTLKKEVNHEKNVRLYKENQQEISQELKQLDSLDKKRKKDNSAIYIDPLSESPQNKNQGSFDFASGKRTSKTQKEKTMDM